MQIKSHAIKIIIAGIILFLIYGFWPEPIEVDIAIAKPGLLTVLVEEEGKTRVIDRFVVSAPVTAFAKRIEYKVGDEVSQNEVLVELEPSRSSILDPRSRAEAEARVEGASSALQAADQNVNATKADLDYAKTEYERKRKLLEGKTISQGEVDLSLSALRRLEAQYRSASFAVDVAKFKLKEAEKILQYSVGSKSEEEIEKYQIKSPVNGKILKIHHESEGIVTTGEPLIEIGDPKALEIQVDVLSEDAIKIHPETKVIFERWGGDYPLEGLVKRVEPTGFTKISALGVEEQRVLVISTITSPYEKWKKLGDGYRVDANFIIWEKNNIITVPSSSLFRKNNQWNLYRIVHNKAKLTPVEVGHSNGLSTEITQGLHDTDTIISYPDATIRDGKSVKIKK